MSAQTSRRRSRARLDEDNDDESADAVRFEQRASSEASEGPKRMRLRGGEAESDEESQEFHSMLGNGDAEPRANGAPGGKDISDDAVDFQPGAIVRVRVDNFVTYQHAEFFPGPNLNMVIGPNGTGKSSLVCAICLGLGYHSNVLGRASSFGEFVKHGEDMATVEVELKKRPKDRQNFVVRLRISREDNSRKFWINGKESPHKGVQALMRALSIQIDNLCQFLPQDKVAEFAGLNSVDLLTKTLQAAAPPEMIEWQNRLRTIYTEQRESHRQTEQEAELLGNMENRQQGLQADVERLREREEIQRAVTDLKHARSFAAYNEARRMVSEAKDRKKEATKKLKRLQDGYGPALQAVNHKQEYRAALEQVVAGRKRVLKDAEKAADDAIEAVSGKDGALNDLEAKKQAEAASLQTRKKEVATTKKKITDLEARLKQDHRPFDAGEWNTKIREQNHLARELDSETRNNRAEMTRILELGRSKKAASEDIQNELQGLDSQEGQQLARLRKVAPDVFRGWEWLRANTDQFEKEVFGPPMLTCSVKDDRYSDLVQSLLQQDDFLCFTTQSKEDHKLLSNQFYRTMGLSVTIRTCMTAFESYRPPMPVQNVQRLGLEGFAISFLEGPEPVLAMLCAEKRLHAAAVGQRDLSEDQYGEVLRGEVISLFAAGKQFYRVNRRKEYGPSAVSTAVRDVRPGRFWTDQPVDTGERAELQRRLAETKDQFQQLKQQMGELKEKEAEAQRRDTEIKEKTDELSRAKSELQREYNMWLAIPDKIDQEKKVLRQKEDDLKEARDRVLGLDDQRDKVHLDKAELVLKHNEQIGAIRAARHALMDVQIRLIEATSDVQGLEEKNQEMSRMVDEERKQLELCEKNLQHHRDVGRQALDEVQEIIAEHPERKDHLSELAGSKSPEEIENEMEAERSKLDYIHATNPNVLQEFERRAAEIERLKRKKTEHDRQMAEMNEQIADLRARWEPRLDELVSRINDAFSYNFEQISCAGEVGVYKDDDFDKWAIEIKVKFREHETLQKLDQHRQSGGERAVSTIFYLMSLQSMAQAPFRVVDEINQGMDPRNERMVHERMVEIACREHTSQYFLITPKLLSGLRYDERMRVLCIASGEHMPADGFKLDFARCVKIQRSLMLAAASA